eukprot:1137338-Pelagomonas_calceolata.AAC.1
MACDPVNLSQFVLDLRFRHLGYWNQFTAPDPRVSNSKRLTACQPPAWLFFQLAGWDDRTLAI